MEKKLTNQMAQAIKLYAEQKGISLQGTSYQTYSMLKYPSQNFPEDKMFLSNNVRGELRNKNVIIVALDEDTISHFNPDCVLERPKNRNREYIPRTHRVITPSLNMEFPLPTNNKL